MAHDFQGGSFQFLDNLIFFQGNSQDALSNAVMAAMKMVYMLTNSEGISKHLSKYTSIDFGIGIDYGDILCTKVGIGGTYDNKDLIWIGNAVNKSTVLSDKGKDSSNYIYVSKIVYDNLNDNVKYHITKDAWGQERKVNMWNSATVLYNNINETCYYTTYHWTIQ